MGIRVVHVQQEFVASVALRWLEMMRCTVCDVSCGVYGYIGIWCVCENEAA